MPLIRQKWVIRSDLRNNPDALFVFGDNLARRGLAGQAAEMRGEFNAIGLPTKRTAWVYLRDSDLREVEMVTRVDRARLIEKISNGGSVVWPADGIGTGLARLRECAPLIADSYDRLLLALEL